METVERKTERLALRDRVRDIIHKPDGLVYSSADAIVEELLHIDTVKAAFSQGRHQGYRSTRDKYERILEVIEERVRTWRMRAKTLEGELAKFRHPDSDRQPRCQYIHGCGDMCSKSWNDIYHSLGFLGGHDFIAPKPPVDFRDGVARKQCDGSVCTVHQHGDGLVEIERLRAEVAWLRPRYERLLGFVDWVRDDNDKSSDEVVTQAGVMRESIS